MPMVETPSARLHYTTRGPSGQTLLLICGLGAHASEWGEGFVGRLSQALRVVILENRGIENSQSLVPSWDLEDMARDACAVLDALGLSRAHVLGSSMGGMIAQRLGIGHPERVASLVLMSTGYGGPDVVPSEPAAAASLFLPEQMPIGERRRRSLQAITAPGFASAHPDAIDALVRMRERQPTSQEVWNMQFKALLKSDCSQAVRAIRAPCLVLHGERDGLIPPENGRRLAARIPGAQFVLLPDCGHLPSHEQPDAAAQAVLDFLAGLHTG